MFLIYRIKEKGQNKDIVYQKKYPFSRNKRG